MTTVNSIREKAKSAMESYASQRTGKAVKVSELKSVGFVAIDGQSDGTGISRAFRSYIEADAVAIVRAHNEGITYRTTL